MKKRLTVRGISALKPAEVGKREVIWDTDVPNFGVRTTDAGAVTFFVMRRIGTGGTPVRRVVAEHRVGAEYTEGMLTAARAKARAYLDLMRAGIDPKQKAEDEREAAAKAEKAARKAEADAAANRFENVAKAFLEEYVHAEENGKPKLRSADSVESTFNRDLIPHFKDKLVSEIRPRDIAELLRKVKKERPAVARKLVAFLSKFYGWVILSGCYGVETSPVVKGVSKTLLGAPPIRTRVLSDSELAEVWRAAKETPAPFGAFVRMLLATGQRRNEVANAKWGEVDFADRLWVVPPERMKRGFANEVALSPLAIEVLQSLAPEEKDRKPNAFIFSTTGGKRPISGFSKAHAALEKKINEERRKPNPTALPIENFTNHDYRRTVRTNLSSLPVPDNISEMIISHARSTLHQIYDQYKYRAEKRRALDLWADKLLSLVEPDKESKVVQLAAARG